MAVKNRNKNKNVVNKNENGTTTTEIKEEDSQTRKRPNRPKKQTKTSIFKNKKFLVIFFICTFVLLLFIRNFLFKNENSIAEDETVLQILRKAVDVEQNIILHQQQILAFLLGEPLATLLKRKLRPIQERVTSLRTQTSQYEKMERIKGGPSKFIEDSLNEIESIEDNYLANLDDEVNVILVDEARQAKALMESAFDVMTRGHYGLEAMYSPTLMEVGIFLNPSTDHDISYIEDLMTKVTLDEVLSALTELADKIQIYEETLKRIDTLKNQFGVEDWDNVNLEEFYEEALNSETWDELQDLVMNVHIQQREEIEKKIIKDNHLHILFIPLGSQLIESVANLQEDLISYSRDKRDAYLKLRETLKEDLKALKLRVLNLRYKYAKIPTKNL